MITALIAAIVTGCATATIPTVIPHIESYVTRKRLQRAHKDTAGTSPNVATKTEPHQPRVDTGKSPVHGRKLRA